MVSEVELCPHFCKASQHKECSLCHDFRCAVHRRGVPTAEKVAIARQWREHVRAQYHDRLLYWSLRWASRMFQDVLVIIIDSMDKVKTMYPKYRAHRKPGYLDGLVRPRSTVSAVLCHGWCTCIYTADEFLSHGASAFCEVLCRALGQVLAISQKTGRPMPRHLVIQSDNTTAQANNSVVSVFLAYLVAMGYFSSATLNFLTVGHTHEDVDRHFAMILLLVLRPKLWETPEEMNALFAEALRPLTEAKKEELIVEEVRHIRDFDGWLGAMGVHLHNAFVTRKGIEASHAFTFKVRADRSTAEVHNIPRKRKRFDEHQEDVFAIAKGRMHMTKTQPPVLAIPHCLLALMHGKEPKNMKAARDMPNDRQRSWSSWQTALTPHLVSATKRQPEPFVSAWEAMRQQSKPRSWSSCHTPMVQECLSRTPPTSIMSICQIHPGVCSHLFTALLHRCRCPVSTARRYGVERWL